MGYPYDECGRELDGNRIFGKCQRVLGHEGEHSMPIDWFGWSDEDYCRFPGCKFLSYREDYCDRHRLPE